MAFHSLEPFGALHAEYLAGAVCAVIANVNRDPKKRPEAFAASDFMPSLARDVRGRAPAAAAPVLLDDPEAQSRLIKQALFGLKPDDNTAA